MTLRPRKVSGGRKARIWRIAKRQESFPRTAPAVPNRVGFPAWLRFAGLEMTEGGMRKFHVIACRIEKARLAFARRHAADCMRRNAGGLRGIKEA